MSGQPAEQSEGFTSSDSRLDAILNQLNALGASSPSQQKAGPTLRSVPDLPVPDPTPSVAPPPVPDLSVAPAPTVPPDLPAAPAPDLSANPAPTVPPDLPAAPAPDLSAVVHDLPVPQAPPLPEIEPISEPTNFTFGMPEAAVPETPSPVVAEPSAETLAQTDIFDLAPVEEAESITVAEPTPTAIVDDRENVEHTEGAELVFELDGPLGEEPLPEQPVPQVAESLQTPIADMASTTPPPVPPAGDTGWVSHHNESDETDETAESAEDTVAEPASFESPEWGDIVENEDVVEEVPFSAFNPHASSTTSESEYETDEELPLPDFTGVWDDAGVPTVWDSDSSISSAVPDPVEIPGSGSGISVGRNELDSLRPAEEEEAKREPAQNLGSKMQLFAVILFGLIAVAVVLLNDPAAVDELREIYNGFFG